VSTPASQEAVSAPLFVGFGEDLPIASFNDMLNYLRFYVHSERLNTLRNAPEDQKPALWAALLRETDPIPTTAQHEGLLAYFTRIRTANERFRGEPVEGWLTDRGRVYVTLGEPDQLAAGGPEYTSRLQRFAWEYQRFQLRLIFQDRTGLGRWTLEPGSEVEFNSVAQRQRVG
jgi:GWxTD domain-containing protein